MRFQTVAVAAFYAAAVARADVLEDLEDTASTASLSASSAISSVSSAAGSVVSSAISRPKFTPTTLKAPFLEQFTDDWETRWQPSHAKKDTTGSEEEWAYVGTWAVEEPTALKGIDGDKGLVVKDRAAHHAISAKFPKPIDNTGKSLVVQYEVKLQDGLECGGAYLKLLQDNEALHAEEFSNASPYVIMFGPDKCGSTNKVHFIFKHKNPMTGEYEEKHLKNTALARITKTTSLYTLIINPDQTYQIKIDGEQVRNGSLLEDFNPPVNPEKEIDDPDETKPADWVDSAKITDPEATKPEDWDEDAAFEIVDEDATKPDDWLEDEPTMIPDPEAEKPEDWDDEEDGDWIPPMVPNPRCDEASGCGPWSPPMMRNPAFKGKWTAPMIDNPAYTGPWAPKKIANPKYYEDKTPANFEPMGAIGYEIWTMQKDILFDNIYIGHSIEDAEKLRKETFDVKLPIEKEEEAASKPAEQEPAKSPMDLKFMDDPVFYIREKVELFMTIAKRSPVEAVRFVPEVAAGFGVLGAGILTLLFVVLGGSAAASPQVRDKVEQAKKEAANAKDQAADAISSAAEKLDGEANKRTTRSSAAVEQ